MNEFSYNKTIEEKIRRLEGPIFIFGANGFIGANMVSLIASIRKDFFALTHDFHHAWRLRQLNVPPGNILHCDILLKFSVEETFRKHSPKTIFNFAAYGAYSKQQDPNLTHETNYIGTLNILQACQDIAAYVHAGTSSEYGINAAAPLENAELQPNSHYAVSKVAASFLIQYFARFQKIPAIHLRLYSVYGPWEEPDRLIPKLIENIRRKTWPPLVSPGISRDFVYVDDCLQAFVDAALNIHPEIFGQSFNIASERKTTIKELIDVCRQEFQITAEPRWQSMANRHWDLDDWYGNSRKAQAQLYWHSRTDLAEGLKKTYQWQESIDYEKRVIGAFAGRNFPHKISCVIACYRDEPAILIMYQRLVRTFGTMGIGYEIIFVNDASPDNSERVIEKICQKDSNVIGIQHSRNFGSQSAFLSGMNIATGDAVVLMDGDLQDPPEIIPQFYAKWLAGNEVVYGIRVKREASWFINVCYKLFYRIFSRWSYIRIPTDAGDFSLIDKKVVKQLIDLQETEQFLRGLRAWVGFRQIGVPYIRPERMFGVSTNNFRKNIRWAKKAIFSFSFLPLEFLSYIGFIITGIAFAALIAQVILKLLMPQVPHGVTTIVILILFFGGIQLLAISIIGEYIGKIFEETKKRPKFIRVSIRKGNILYDTTKKMENYVHNITRNI